MEYSLGDRREHYISIIFIIKVTLLDRCKFEKTLQQRLVRRHRQLPSLPLPRWLHWFLLPEGDQRVRLRSLPERSRLQRPRRDLPVPVRQRFPRPKLRIERERLPTQPLPERRDLPRSDQQLLVLMPLRHFREDLRDQRERLQAGRVS